MDGQVFKEEFSRLMRAINDSLEREAELQRLLRRTKESLIAVALRLQVAIKVSQEDELTIMTLINQAAESKAKELASIKQAQDAQELIQGLNLEINTLKRKLRAAELERGSSFGNASSSSSGANPEVLSSMNEAADHEVEYMMSRSLNIPVLPGTGGHPESATPFNRWKMQQFMYTPDTPAASLAHEKEVVDMLLEAAEYNLREDHLRTTKSGIAKMKHSLSAAHIKDSKAHGYDYRLGTPAASLGANDYEGKGEDFTGVMGRTESSHALSRSALEKKNDNNEFFLDQNLLQWGSAPRFDKNNMARHNIWSGTSSLSKEIGAVKPMTTANGSRTAAGGARPKESPVKLKSLRVNNNSGGGGTNLSASLPMPALSSKLVV